MKKIAFIIPLVLLVASIGANIFFIIHTIQTNQSSGYGDGLPVVITNGFTLNGNEQLEYNNVTLVIRGQINLLGFSNLTLINCHIIAELEFHKQFYLDVRDSASFIVVNCELESENWYWYNFRYEDYAIVYHENFQHGGIPWQQCSNFANISFINSGADITFGTEFEGNIFVNGSDNVYFEILLRNGDYDLEFPEEYVEEWHLNISTLTVDVYNSAIHTIDIDLEPGVNAIVRNANDFAVGWIFGGGWGAPSAVDYIEIVGLKEGYYSDTTFVGDNSSLRMVNTNFRGWWPITNSDFNLVVRDGSIVDPWVYHDSNMTMIDCEIYYISSADNGVYYIYNSTILNNIVALDNSIVYCFNIEFSGSVSIAENAHVYIDGTEIFDS